MKARSKNLRVFVSSTSEDLREYRAVARLEILNTDWYPVMMEHFGASTKPTVDACREKLKECDLMLLIIAFRRGWVPTVQQGGNDEDSITSFELAYARERNIPALAFLANESWPGNLWEDDEKARKWIRKFRDDLNLPAVFFDHEPPTAPEADRLTAFRAKLRAELVRYQQQLMEEESAESFITSGADFYNEAKQDLIEGQIIPFIGQRVYGDGPLSTNELIRALAASDKETSEEPTCLATAAEYRERVVKSRHKFLRRLHEAIVEQSAQAIIPPLYKLLVNVKTPSLIVSATYDLILENVLQKKLADDGKSLVIVSHIVHSQDSRDEGKLVVFRGDAYPEFCFADQFDRKDADVVVYKPLGSPLLHDRFELDEGIDTVVITELDYLNFLGRLENELTKIPSAFSRSFQLRSLLFLGYALDVWQYRLVMQVFQSIGFREGEVCTLAVREPKSTMEQLAWKRLEADLIPMDPGDFARQVSSELNLIIGEQEEHVK
jgi:uncharacterized protein DUF4062/SIR2-like protein